MPTLRQDLQDKFSELILSSITDIDSLMVKLSNQHEVDDDNSSSDEIRFD